jgi:hypothetical protein
MEIQAAIDITFRCNDCGDELETVFHTWDSECIEVTPCEKCLEKAKDEAEAEGYERGLEERENA